MQMATEPAEPHQAGGLVGLVLFKPRWLCGYHARDERRHQRALRRRLQYVMRGIFNA